MEIYLGTNQSATLVTMSNFTNFVNLKGDIYVENCKGATLVCSKFKQMSFLLFRAQLVRPPWWLFYLPGLMYSSNTQRRSQTRLSHVKLSQRRLSQLKLSHRRLKQVIGIRHKSKNKRIFVRWE